MWIALTAAVPGIALAVGVRVKSWLVTSPSISLGLAMSVGVRVGACVVVALVGYHIAIVPSLGAVPIQSESAPIDRGCASWQKVGSRGG